MTEEYPISEDLEQVLRIIRNIPECGTHQDVLLKLHKDLLEMDLPDIQVNRIMTLVLLSFEKIVKKEQSICWKIANRSIEDLNNKFRLIVDNAITPVNQ